MLDIGQYDGPLFDCIIVRDGSWVADHDLDLGPYDSAFRETRVWWTATCEVGFGWPLRIMPCKCRIILASLIPYPSANPT